MRNVFFILFTFLINYSGSTINCQPGYDKSTVTISFQDNFKHDLVSMKLDHVNILENELLDSNTSGSANIQIELKRVKPGTIEAKYLNFKRRIIFKKTIRVALFLNGKESLYILDLNKGKYLELSKKGKNQFYFKQSDS